jgi:hypothetical protein
MTLGLVAGTVLEVAKAEAVSIQVVGDSLKGRVFNSSTGRGVYGLSVRLIPARATGLPTKITFTTSDGRFRFGRLKRSRYVLEISRGMAVVYRREIDTNVEQSFQIALRAATR